MLDREGRIEHVELQWNDGKSWKIWIRAAWTARYSTRLGLRIRVLLFLVWRCNMKQTTRVEVWRARLEQNRQRSSRVCNGLPLPPSVG